MLSGLAGVYFEKILKESHTPASLWVRNVQLSFYSLFPALFLGVMFIDGEEIAKYGFFVGYNWVVWAAIGLQALGGVVVAMVVSYADNIAKNFATSISILLSCLASVWFFEFTISRQVSGSSPPQHCCSTDFSSMLSAPPLCSCRHICTRAMTGLVHHRSRSRASRRRL